MKIIYHISIWSVIFSLLCSSCSDFLNQEPDKQISINEQLKSKSGFLAAFNGLYYSLENLVSGKTFIYPDLQAGALTFAPNKNGELGAPSLLENSYNFNDLADESDYESVYVNAYDIINQANLLLEYVDQCTGFSEAERKQVRAESLSIRAFTHFLLSRMYAQNISYNGEGAHLGVVYNHSTLRAGQDFPGRQNKKQTYQYIVEDLKLARSLFSSEQALLQGASHMFFNKDNTLALLARIALDHNDWEQAYHYADNFLQETSLSLVPSNEYVNQWQQPDQTLSEVLLEFAAPLEPVNSVAGQHFFYEADTNGVLVNFKEKALVASADLLELYSPSDLRRQLFATFPIKTISEGKETNENYHFIQKFQGNPGALVLRVSELYLIRAEAAFRIDEGKLPEALEDLNEIRVRAGLQALQIPEVSDFLEELFLERCRELACEGHLLFDLMRFKKEINRGADCLSNQCSLPYPHPYFILPVPQKSIDLNENLIQNEDY